MIWTGPGSPERPRDRHPAFHGSYDWHSCVHSHWMLVRLLRRDLLDGALAGEVRARLTRNLSAERIAGEVATFEQPEYRGFERPYGWAWLLTLAAEARRFDDDEARVWSASLEPLERLLVDRTREHFTALERPLREGTHRNTAFALALILDHARAVGESARETFVVERARTYFEDDRDVSIRWEPSGYDFLSPALQEADLMRRVLSPADFRRWLEGFFPTLFDSGTLEPLTEPVHVADPSDGHLVHLAGLNLSRAWTLRALSRFLGRPAVLEDAAGRHEAAGLASVPSGEYAGDHWLASFAVYLLT